MLVVFLHTILTTHDEVAFLLNVLSVPAAAYYVLAETFAAWADGGVFNSHLRRPKS
jgi:hypothetical protein